MKDTYFLPIILIGIAVLLASIVNISQTQKITKLQEQVKMQEIQIKSLCNETKSNGDEKW